MSFAFFVVIVEVLFLSVAQTSNNVHLGILVQYKGDGTLGAEAEIAIQLAIEKIYTSQTLTNIHRMGLNFSYEIADTECDIGTGLYLMVELFRNTDAFIGPSCDVLCQSGGLLAAKWNKPMISFGCGSIQLSNKNQYTTFARTAPTYNDLAYFLVDILHYFHWNRVMIVEGQEEIWRETSTLYQETLDGLGFDTDLFNYPTGDQSVLRSRLSRVASDTRVFLLLAYGREISYIMCAADNLGLLNGEYVFISIDFALKTHFSDTEGFCGIVEVLNGKYPKTGTKAGLLDITIEVSTDGIMFEKFVNLIQNTTGESHSREVAIHAGMLHDAIFLYAMGLDTVLGHGGTAQNGSMIIDALINTSFPGMTGNVIIDSKGKRKAKYHLHNIQNSHYVTVAVSDGSIGGMSLYRGTDIVWPGGKLITPLGRPVCGWKGEMCLARDNSVTTIIVATVILFCVLVATSLAVSIIMYRKKLRQGRLSSMSWKIAFENLNTSIDRRTHKTRSSRFMSRDTLKTVAMESFPSLNVMRSSMESDTSGGDQLFAKIAIYDGTAVALKMVRKNYLAITPEVVTEINQIIHLKHNNINPLMGACVDPFKICLVSVYCNRGSLQDVLENDDIKLDRIFKLSFAHDIARGMAYLHQSPVKTHGQLKSSNVLIDGHWVCKITDIAMPKFREGERSSSRGEHAVFYSKLWTAPELLRAPCEYTTGTPKGDVYSYAIILQEIILRTGPYGYINEDPEDIISRVKILEHPPYRPKVPQDAGEETLLDLMRICWEEIPVFRPNFVNVVETLRNANNGKTTNLVDQMIHMMEKYADHLEDLVNERTKRLEEEQKRTDELLCRMLPKSIASDLKMGKRVVPETFECVTIFFSDIVGFTALSSESTAMEKPVLPAVPECVVPISTVCLDHARLPRLQHVVDFLNDLYISFDTIIENYDVYKVETIGDAYMVVSGLPVRNGKRHAGEVCTMALDLLSCVTTFRIRHRPQKQLQLRIGIHSGPVAAGVVGLKMPRFCLFGDTVNYASRMESCGLALRIHISPECKCILDELGGFITKCRGDISVKGKGIIRTYFLLTKEGLDKPLPDLRLAASLEEHEFK